MGAGAGQAVRLFVCDGARGRLAAGLSASGGAGGVGGAEPGTEPGAAQLVAPVGTARTSRMVFLFSSASRRATCPRSAAMASSIS
jgi:hypothetical protein